MMETQVDEGRTWVRRSLPASQAEKQVPRPIAPRNDNFEGPNFMLLDRGGRFPSKTPADIRRCIRRHPPRVWGSAPLPRCGVAHPFASMSDDRLASVDIELAALVLNSEQPLQHDGELVELRSLSGLEPP